VLSFSVGTASLVSSSTRCATVLARGSGCAAQRVLASVFTARWRLSDRQNDCVRLLAYGVPKSDLADRLGISTRAVDEHLRNVRARCGETDSCGLVQRLLQLTIEAGLRGDEGWIRQLGSRRRG
jgi:DNA-binding CsgD family transcriptional regulator